MQSGASIDRGLLSVGKALDLVSVGIPFVAAARSRTTIIELAKRLCRILCDDMIRLHFRTERLTTAGPSGS